MVEPHMGRLLHWKVGLQENDVIITPNKTSLPVATWLINQELPPVVLRNS